MLLAEIFEKAKIENAQAIEKYGPWSGYNHHEQSEAVRDEFCEWYKAYCEGNHDGEHGEINELIDLINVACRRIMALTGEPNA